MIRNRPYLNRLNNVINNFRFNNSRFLVKYTPFFLKKVGKLSIVSLKKKWKRYSNFYLSSYNYLFNRLVRSTKFSTKFFKLELKSNVSPINLIFSESYSSKNLKKVVGFFDGTLYSQKILKPLVKLCAFSEQNMKYFSNFIILTFGPYQFDHFDAVDDGLVLFNEGAIKFSTYKKYQDEARFLLLGSVNYQDSSFLLSYYCISQNLVLSEVVRRYNI